MKVKHALISVSDKTGISEVAKSLIEFGYSIIASDGTAAYLEDLGIETKRIEEITEYPELFAGRVKSLHPAIHGGLLFDQTDPEQVAQAERFGIEPIEVVIVDLYPASKFDIGGPALIRAAAKNWRAVSVITSKDQYEELIKSLTTGAPLELRKSWALAALEVTARYDIAIMAELGEQLRYGENPHQNAAKVGSRGLAGAELIQGKQPSFNNYRDAELALKIVRDHRAPTFAIVKHAMPCGIASSDHPADAFAAALATDRISAFGGVIAANCEIDENVAKAIVAGFFEVIVAPSFSSQARLTLSNKPKLRALCIKAAAQISKEFHHIDGGLLLQDSDLNLEDGKDWELVSGAPATDEQFKDLEFAWRCVARTRSNAVVIASSLKTIGIGAGEVNRLAAANQAILKAGSAAAGSVAAGDGFFPFTDGLSALIAAGISAVVAPSGSIRDGEVVAAAKSAGLTLYFSPRRHFSHN